MRAYRFGSFSELVPTSPPCTHEDIPRLESYATPATENISGINMAGAEFKKHRGQKLRGTMIQDFVS